ncbi:SMI1/KNR4 family protein [Streptomyces sp. NRRL WC-3742]|uniref:SMI1/KNR4 family protein n=1 Tax=Streptomyces sp. NRRL WC-3742 TaxID=1463934 RepID=UPI0004CA8811|nr:SMI1/KNR4 family protein [Streptomyces sp. NRRL WC-3742]
MSWSGVRERVLALRKAPGAAKVFGANGHGFRLDPPLSEAEVAEAERQFGVSFPPAYRTFLLEVAAGGAGPDYGLYPLRRDDQGWHWVALGDTREVNPLLGRPFPSEAERARRTEELDAREPREEDFPDEDAYRAAFRAWDDEWEPLNEAMTAGAVCLGHQGCGYFTWLAVTGPDSGTLWNDLRAADGPLEPLTDGTGRLDFHTWYLTWLRRATREAAGA